jgi:hypothetical protein
MSSMPVALPLLLLLPLMIPHQTLVNPLTGLNNIRSNRQSAADVRLRVAIDYLRLSGVIPFAQLTQLIQYLNDCLDDHLVLDLPTSKPAYLGRLWSFSCKSPGGVRLFWDVLIDGNIKILVDIPGTPLRRIDTRDCWRMCLGFHNYYKLKCRRFDVALDDYLRRISANELIEIGRKDNYRLVESYKLVSSKNTGKSACDTVYFGSRESEKYLRFYDAEERHGIPADRWEVELKRRHADAAFTAFCSLSLGMELQEFDGMASLFLASLVTGSVDFVDAENASPGERYDRLERLPFWQSMIDDCGGSLRLSPARSKPTLQRTLLWIKRQVSRSLAVVRKAYGHQVFYKWLDSTLRDGEKRFDSYHQSVVVAVQNEISKDMFPVS